MSDARPLADREKRRPPPAPARRPDAVADEAPARFELEHSGGRVEGRAPGIDRKLLRRLRAGGFEPDARVDLHGLDARGARRALREALARALDEGARCLLVVHGRGRHSEGGAVLKPRLADWLAEPPHGARVMAFAAARERDGGAGASYVLLRRPR